MTVNYCVTEVQSNHSSLENGKPQQSVKLRLSTVQFRHTRFMYFFRECQKSGLRCQTPLAFAAGHAAVFVVNAALVASEWQNRT